MILKYISDDPSALVISRPTTNTNGFCNGNLNVIDILPVPELFENAIGKSKYQDILDRFFPQVVVNPINLVLLEDLVNYLI